MKFVIFLYAESIFHIYSMFLRAERYPGTAYMSMIRLYCRPLPNSIVLKPSVYTFGLQENKKGTRQWRKA